MYGKENYSTNVTLQKVQFRKETWLVSFELNQFIYLAV